MKVSDSRGQALVEFALILPVFLLLVVGMLEFARAWNTYQVMVDAAREGARRAVLKNDIMDRDSVKAAMWRHLATAGYDPQYALPGMHVGPDDKWKVSGENIVVTLALPYRFSVIPGLTLNMRTAFTMRNE